MLFVRPCAGRQETKGGARVAAGGLIEGETAKKAVAETLDGAVALLGSKNGGSGKAKKTPKEKTPEQLAAKGLAKDIKAYLGFKMHAA